MCSVSDGSLLTLTVRAGSVIEVSDAARVGSLGLSSGATGFVSGGFVSGQLFVGSGATCEITGGTTKALQAREGSTVIIEAGELMLSGEPVSTVPQPLASDDVFTATLADGSVMVIAPCMITGQLAAGSTEFRPAALPPPRAMGIVSGNVDVKGLRPTERLSIESGTIPDGFRVAGAEMDATNSTIGDGFVAAFSSLALDDVDVGDYAGVVEGSWSHEGGSIGPYFRVGLRSDVVLTDVQLDDRARVEGPATVQLMRGRVSDLVIEDSDVTLVGCVIDDTILINDLGCDWGSPSCVWRCTDLGSDV